MTRRTMTWTVIAATVALTSIGMRWYLLPSAGRGVREVRVRRPSPGEFPTPGRMDVFDNRAQLEAAYPGVAFEPADAVDFSREKLVQIGWEGHFCRDTPLVCDARAGGRWAMFHDQPTCGTTHDCFCRLLLDRWFAVPKHATPSVVGESDVTLLDLGVLTGFVALGMGALAALGLALRLREARFGRAQADAGP